MATSLHEFNWSPGIGDPTIAGWLTVVLYVACAFDCWKTASELAIKGAARALGMKVSDEFAVPLCRIHHRQVHRAGNEIKWWTDLRLDPLPLARNLWRQTRAKVFPDVTVTLEQSQIMTQQQETMGALNGPSQVDEASPNDMGRSEQNILVVHPTSKM